MPRMSFFLRLLHQIERYQAYAKAKIQYRTNESLALEKEESQEDFYLNHKKDNA